MSRRIHMLNPMTTAFTDLYSAFLSSLESDNPISNSWFLDKRQCSDSLLLLSFAQNFTQIGVIKTNVHFWVNYRLHHLEFFFNLHKAISLSDFQGHRRYFYTTNFTHIKHFPWKDLQFSISPNHNSHDHAQAYSSNTMQRTLNLFTHATTQTTDTTISHNLSTQAKQCPRHFARASGIRGTLAGLLWRRVCYISSFHSANNLPGDPSRINSYDQCFLFCSAV